MVYNGNILKNEVFLLMQNKMCPLTRTGDVSCACDLSDCALYIEGRCGLVDQVSAAVAGAAMAKAEEPAVSGRDAGGRDDRTLEDKVSDLLLSCGARPHVKGYNYVRMAIMKAVDDPACTGSLVKGLYSDVAAANGTTGSRVERAIRHVIEIMFDNPDHEVIDLIFKGSCSASKGKPTNGQFICTLADYIRRGKA